MTAQEQLSVGCSLCCVAGPVRGNPAPLGRRHSHTRHPLRPPCVQFDIQLDEEGAEKISTVQEAADLIAAQIDK